MATPIYLAVVFLLISPTVFCISVPDGRQQDSVQQLAEEYAKLHPNEQVPSSEDTGPVGQGSRQRRDPPALERQNVTNLWPEGTVYYEFEEGLFADWQIQNVHVAMAQLTDTLQNDDGSPCVQFRPWVGQSPDYVSINYYTGCRSHIIGRGGGRQELSLAFGCLIRNGVIMHELLHTLGFQHEQKRLDSGEYVTVNWDNIKEERKFNFEATDEQYTGYDVGVPYDYDSILHYGAYSFAIDRSIPTLIPNDPNAEIGQRDGLSPLDILKVRRVYGCEE